MKATKFIADTLGINEQTGKLFFGVFLSALGYFANYVDAVGNVIEAGLYALLLPLIAAFLLSIGSKFVWKNFLPISTGGTVASIVMIVLDLIF
jgi:formate hydrogenlyase subunit 4